MRYRIKIITFKNGRKEYRPQYKMLLGWAGLSYEGKPDIMWPYAYNSRDIALKGIDCHYEGNNNKQTIEFEYIDKP